MAAATVSFPPRLRASSGLPGGLTGLLDEAGREVLGMSEAVILVLSSEVAGIASHRVAMADSYRRLRGRGDVSHRVAVADSHWRLR